MTRLQHVCLGVVIWAALEFPTPMPLVSSGPSSALAADQYQAAEAKGESVRPEVGKPLQAAQELLRAQNYRQALVKIQEADGAKDKTAYEVYVIDRLRGVAATGAGDTDVAIRSFESSIGSDRLSPSEKLKMMEAVAGMYYRKKDYPNTIAWASRYGKEGGASEEMHRLLIQAYYLNNDLANAEKELRSELQAAENSGRPPPEDRLQMLASCYFKQTDMLGYAATLERLVTYYPKKEYWADLVYRVQSKPGFAARLGLDVYRLKVALGIPATASQYMEMTELALQAGFPAEAKSFIDKGVATGVLGSGPDADRQKRLRDLAAKRVAEDQKTLAQDEAEATAAKDGSALVNAGFAYVVKGQYDKGVALMEQGIRKGGLKRPDDAKLRLGIAYLLGGQKEQAIRVFKSVQGADGVADLARLWAIYARRPG